MQNTNDHDIQIFYARLAGFVYLLLILLYMGGQFLNSSILGVGDFASRAHNATNSEHLYRIGLALQLMASVCTTVLAYALYVTLKPANERIAQLAMLFRLGETFVGAVAVIFSFVQLRIYTAAAAVATATTVGTSTLGGSQGMDQWQTLMKLANSSHFAGFNMSTLFFSVGSILFFSVFLKSNYLPKVQALFGIFASILVVLTSLGNLLLPEYAGTIQLGFIPMFISEIVTGLWLLFRGVKVR
nr:DUF4386 domain-containing protein [uncultured Undibacterium sp.]